MTFPPLPTRASVAAGAVTGVLVLKVTVPPVTLIVCVPEGAPKFTPPVLLKTTLVVLTLKNAAPLAAAVLPVLVSVIWPLLPNVGAVLLVLTFRELAVTLVVTSTAAAAAV